MIWVGRAGCLGLEKAGDGADGAVEEVGGGEAGAVGEAATGEVGAEVL